jgi:hypothetical protein
VQKSSKIPFFPVLLVVAKFKIFSHYTKKSGNSTNIRKNPQKPKKIDKIPKIFKIP